MGAHAGWARSAETLANTHVLAREAPKRSKIHTRRLLDLCWASAGALVIKVLDLYWTAAGPLVDLYSALYWTHTAPLTGRSRSTMRDTRGSRSGPSCTRWLPTRFTERSHRAAPESLRPRGLEDLSPPELDNLRPSRFGRSTS